MKDPEEIFEQRSDYKEIILHILSYKYLFFTCIVILLAAAYFLNKVSKPIYENTTSVIVNKKNLYSFLKTEDLMQGLGSSSKNDALENDLTILKSFKNVSEAINAINASVSYYTEDNLISSNDKLLPFKITNELYTACPVNVKFDIYHVQPIDLAFKISIISEKSFKLTASGEHVSLYDYLENTDAGLTKSVKINGTFTFGEVIEGDGYKIKIEPRDDDISDFVNETYFFAFNNLNYLSLMFQRSLTMTPSGKNSSIINVSLKGENPDKITDFLNALTRVFIQENLDKKNQVINNTVEFIDQQITNISDSLVYTENKLQNFRSKYKVTNLSFQGEKIYEKMNTLETKKADLLVKKQYYAYLKDYFKRNEGVEDLVAPSSMDVDDPILNKLIQDIVTANARRVSLLQTGSEKNLFLKDIEITIQNLRQTIMENVNSNLSNIELSLANSNNRISNLSAEISQLPKTERELFGIQRKFKLNDAIYTFLLQKRAEAQISKSSNTSDYEIIDPAKRITAFIVKPKKKLNYLIALFLGIMLPLLYIIVNDFLRTRISSPSDLSGFKVGMAGFLYPYLKDTPIIFERDTASPVAEAVRTLCISLDLMESDNRVITFTSSQPGDGKTFAALNTAACYSLMGFKTALVECDFRNPSLRRIFKIKEDKGVCGFLSGERSSLDPIKTEAGNNLDIYHSGKVKKNPVEFLSAKSLELLINDLKSKYEKIIIDTTDIDDHSDLYFLLPFSDRLLYMIRHNKTRKKELHTGLKNIYAKGYENIGVVVNQVPLKNNPYK